MISKYSHKTLNWIDIEAPLEEEINHVVDLYSIPEFIKERLFLISEEDQISLEYGYIFASLKIPSFRNSDVNNRVTFVVCDNFVLTIHNEKLHGLNKFSKEMELDMVAEEKINNNKLLFAYLLKNLYIGFEQQLVDNKTKIESLKKHVIKNTNKLKKFRIITILLTILLIIFICL